MPFIEIKEDQTTTITPKPGPITMQKTHWIDGQANTCRGDGCDLCDQGDRPQVRFIVPIEDADPNLNWGISATVLGQLATIPELLVIGKPSPLYVTRTGQGLDTKFQVHTTVPPAKARAPKKPAESPTGETFESAVYEVLKGIDGRLKAIEEKDDY